MKDYSLSRLGYGLDGPTPEQYEKMMLAVLRGAYNHQIRAIARNDSADILSEDETIAQGLAPRLDDCDKRMDRLLKSRADREAFIKKFCGGGDV